MLVHAAVPSAIVERPHQLFRTHPLILAGFRGTPASRAWRTVEAFDDPAPRARPLSRFSPSLPHTDGRVQTITSQALNTFGRRARERAGEQTGPQVE